MFKAVSSSPPKTSDTNPIFWDGVIDLAHLDIKGYTDLLSKLKNHQYKSLRLEKKNTSGAYPIYGMRMNDTIRVLATELEVDKRRYLILLEVLLRHEYDSSKFMDSDTLTAFMTTNRLSLESYIRGEEKNRAELVKVGPERLEPCLYKSVFVHQNKILSLSEEQVQLMMGLDKTLLVHGGPGSGKSVLALSLLSKELGRYTGKEKCERLLYITQSAALARKMSELWLLHPHSNEYGKEVLFCTFESIVKAHLHLADDALVGKDRFITWCINYLGHSANKQHPVVRGLIDKHGSKAKVAEFIYQEFRIICGYELKHYVSAEGLSGIHSHVSEPAIRQWISKAYQDYDAVLKQEGKRDVALIPAHELSGLSFDFVTVDEAQDFSYAQLRAIYSWRKRNKIAVLNDINQSLEDTQSKTQFMIELSQSDDCQTVMLSGSYRCPKQVVALANAVLNLKLIVTGGLMDKVQQLQLVLTKEQENQPQVLNALHWVSRLEEIPHHEELRAKMAGSADVLIVCSLRFKDKAKELFKNCLVITTHDIHRVKGLQFAKVILYHPFDDVIFHCANQEPVIGDPLNATVPKHKPKEGNARPEYAAAFNCLYTAITRCSEQVIVIQKEGHDQEKLVRYVKKELFGEQLAPIRASKIDTSQLKRDSEETWLQRAREALENNSPEFALEIFKDQLKKNKQEFEIWRKGIEKLTTREELAVKQPPKVLPATESDQRKSINLPIKEERSIAIRKQKKKPLKTIEVIQEAVKTNRVSLIQELFFNRELVCDSVTEYPYLLVTLLKDENSKKLLSEAFKDYSFISRIAALPALLSMLFAINPATNRPIINQILTNKATRGIFGQLFNEKAFLTRLSEDKRFIAILTQPIEPSSTKLTAFLYLLLKPEEDLLSNLLQNRKLVKELVENQHFIDSFDISPEPGVQSRNIMYSILSDKKAFDILLFLLGNTVFFEKYCNKETFIDGLLQPVSIPERGIKDSSALCYLILYEGKHQPVIEKLITQRKFFTKLINRPDFIDALFRIAKDKGLVSSQNGTSPLLILHSLVSEKSILLKKLFGEETIIKRLLEHKELVPTLFHRIHDRYHQSGLYIFALRNKATGLFSEVFNNKPLREQLIANKQLYPAVCSRLPNSDKRLKNSSILSEITHSGQGLNILKGLLAEKSFLEGLINEPEFIPTLLAPLDSQESNLAPNTLFNFVAIQSIQHYFISLMRHASFRKHLISHPDFITQLLVCATAKGNGMTASALYFMLSNQQLRSLLIDSCQDNLFLNALINHEEFINTLCKPRLNPVELEINFTSLYWLLQSDDGLSLFCRFFDNERFIDQLLENEELIDSLLTALFLCPTHQESKEVHQKYPAFFALMLSDKGRSLFAKLCEHELFYNTVYNHDGIAHALLFCQSDLKNTPLVNDNALFYLFLNEELKHLFLEISNDSEFYEELINHPSLDNVLLSRYKTSDKNCSGL